MLLQTRFATRLLGVSVVSLLTLALAAPAVAGTVYSWMTSDGTYAYADSLKGVPKAYRAEAKRAQMQKLQNYSRFTPSDRVARGDYADRLGDHLDRYRTPVRTVATSTSTQVPTVHVRTSRNGNGIDDPLPGEGAVVIERVRTQLKGDATTRSYTIVRQGAEVIAAFKGQDSSRRVVEVHASDLLDYRAADESTDL